MIVWMGRIQLNFNIKKYCAVKKTHSKISSWDCGTWLILVFALGLW
jgi:hypothetical protein